MKLTIDHFSRRKELIQMLKERGVKRGVEVGTDHGQYAEQICKAIPDLKLTCVDPWVPYTEGAEVHDQPEMDKIYKEAQDRLTKYDTRFMKMTSMEAVKSIPDNWLDFVFIDGNHDTYHVFEDITEWTKKVKPGGIVCGHDYKEDQGRNYGVIEAVDRYVEDNNVSPLFVLKGGGNFSPCWLFFKQ